MCAQYFVDVDLICHAAVTSGLPQPRLIQILMAFRRAVRGSLPASEEPTLAPPGSVVVMPVYRAQSDESVFTLLRQYKGLPASDQRLVREFVDSLANDINQRALATSSASARPAVENRSRRSSA